MTDIAGSIDVTDFMLPVNSAFSTATRAYVQTTGIAGASVLSTIYITNSVNGYGYIGYSVDSRQSFSLALATGGLNDSLIIPIQDSVYTTPEYILKYPVAYNVNWYFSGPSATIFSWMCHLPGQAI